MSDIKQEETALVPAAAEVFSLVPHTMGEAIEFAKLIAGSNLCPKEYRGKPADVLIAVQLGLEIVGCSPLQALQNIAVINGRPVMWGDLVLALVKRSGLLEAIIERDPQEALVKKEGRCEVHRRGEAEPVVRTFTHHMAETAGLVKRAGADGPWATHPGRMLQMRARAWALRDCFPDVLKGLRTREEEEDLATVAAPVQMPRRASETARIDDFLAEQGTTPTSAGPPPSPQVEESANAEWIGRIREVSSKSGVTNKKPWTLYTVKTDDGDFGTFDEAIADGARTYAQFGKAVRIRWAATARGNRTIEALAEAESETPTS